MKKAVKSIIGWFGDDWSHVAKDMKEGVSKCKLRFIFLLVLGIAVYFLFDQAFDLINMNGYGYVLLLFLAVVIAGVGYVASDYKCVLGPDKPPKAS